VKVLFVLVTWEVMTLSEEVVFFVCGPKVKQGTESTIGQMVSDRTADLREKISDIIYF